MGLRSLVSLGLILVPIAATLGILLGIDFDRRASGQSPLFVDNGVVNNQYCQKAYGITPETSGVQYTLNPNQWGWNPGDPGNLCMNVTTFNNASYPTNISAPHFSVTWQYPQNQTQAVHAFPNIKLDSTSSQGRFPAQISSIDSIPVSAQWSYTIGSQAPTFTAGQTESSLTSLGDLTTANVNANVAIDMFLDSDQTKAQSTTDASFEVMVWLAMIGPSAQPLGYADGIKSTAAINGTTFNLYFGTNGFGQNVLTWLAAGDLTPDFTGDILPLLQLLAQSNNAAWPSSSVYLGYIGLGSETYWSPVNVTFDVRALSMDVRA